MTPFAEVIGDPVAHSLSPAIHLHWLRALAAPGDFLATRVGAAGLAAFVRLRRRDPRWAGCSVTAPHKQAIMKLLDRVTDTAREAGAVNCVFREGDRLVGGNTDLAGLSQALAGIALGGRKAVVIGAGGAARAAVCHLRSRRPGEIVILVRDPPRAQPLLREGVRAAPIETACDELAGARLIVNATPLGMAGGCHMPAAVLNGLAGAPGASVMDMVYDPLDTPLLGAARARGLHAVDGLEMLVGQARQAFRLFFGREPPGGDEALRAYLVDRRR